MTTTPDVPIKPQPPKEPTLAEKAEPVLTALRVLLTGDQYGRVRRPLLYAIIGFSVIIGFAADGAISAVFGAIAIVALLLLAWTDQPVGT